MTCKVIGLPSRNGTYTVGIGASRTLRYFAFSTTPTTSMLGWALSSRAYTLADRIVVAEELPRGGLIEDGDLDVLCAIELCEMPAAQERNAGRFEVSRADDVLVDGEVLG